MNKREHDKKIKAFKAAKSMAEQRRLGRQLVHEAIKDQGKKLSHFESGQIDKAVEVLIKHREKL